MAFEAELLKVLATATSTMDDRVQEIIIRTARREPEIRGMEQFRVEFNAKDSVRMSLTDYTQRKIPKELQIRAD